MVKNPTPIRWLSFFESTLCITACWTMLETFFRHECSNPLTRNNDAVTLEEYFSDPLSKAQHFMNLQVFPKLYVVEKELQTEKYLYTSGRRLSRELYVFLLRMIMKEDYIMTRPLEEVNLARTNQMNRLEQSTLDPMVADILNQLTPEECTKF
ncbi:hypothetical protein QAD02_008291 [Eretmocerus hayati]|uniref:Uncharacterized protein n=1 Tax=Eretmocerus hayati TaxID=131215 RepID=A0ACC2N6F8_9HYME|nr:hypothetical protein QAD02_008291 [Eretmocerus hayati]